MNVRAGHPRDLLATLAVSITIAFRGAFDLLLGRNTSPEAPAVPSSPRGEHGTAGVEPCSSRCLTRAWTEYMIECHIEDERTRKSWMRVLDQIDDADDELAAYLDVERQRDREDAEVAWLDELWPDRPSWDEGAAR